MSAQHRCESSQITSVHPFPQLCSQHTVGVGDGTGVIEGPGEIDGDADEGNIVGSLVKSSLSHQSHQSSRPVSSHPSFSSHQSSHWLTPPSSSSGTLPPSYQQTSASSASYVASAYVSLGTSGYSHKQYIKHWQLPSFHEPSR